MSEPSDPRSGIRAGIVATPGTNPAQIAEWDDSRPVRVSPPDVTVITGAAGWLGRALVDHFTRLDGPHSRPGRIRALVTGTPDAVALAGLPGVDPVVGDVRRPDGLFGLFEGLRGTVDVIHAAGVIHPARADDFEEVNARGTANVMTAARANGVRRVVHVSSNSPFGVNSHRADHFRNDEPYRPYYGYGRSKMRAELSVLDAVTAGLNAVIVRPPWFYGPFQPPRQTTFFRMVRAGRFPIIGDGRQRRSMVYVDNLVQGIVAAELTPTPPGRGWWIADARPYEVVEIVETVGRVLAGEGFEVVPNRIRLPALAGRLAERADAFIQRAGRYLQPVHVLGEMDKTIACDVSAARDELGYEPSVELEEGMRRSVRWCVEQGMNL
jgi:nucleoside-diphosphate-sugar epimerase